MKILEKNLITKSLKKNIDSSTLSNTSMLDWNDFLVLSNSAVLPISNQLFLPASLKVKLTFGSKLFIT